jgi:hypothetical protein
MNWAKRGLIYCPDGRHGWDRAYAHLPTAYGVDSGILRIYFASLDEQKYGRIGCIDVKGENPSEILRIHPAPVLDLGEPGTFDDAGVNPSCVMNRRGDIYLYYVGWQRSHRVPYLLFAGLAVSSDGVRFRRLSRTPLLERTAEEPFIRSAVTIVVDNGTFRCWYVSAQGWTTIDGQQYPEYVIRYAESADGLSWKAYDHICIPVVGDEFGIGRPWVVQDGKLYRMWYSIRSRVEPYRIGYAESMDGLQWTRKDGMSGLHRSESGWDSEMICYPCVYDFAHHRYVFYNGNRHGSTGFGYAVGDAHNG